MKLLAVVVAALAIWLATVGSALSSYSLFPSGRVCGQSACFAVRGQTSAALYSWETSDRWEQLSPPPPAPYYTMRFRITQFRGIDISEEVLYVPSRHMVRVYDNRTEYGPSPVGPYWRGVSNSNARIMNQVVKKIAAHSPLRNWPPHI